MKLPIKSLLSICALTLALTAPGFTMQDDPKMPATQTSDRVLIHVQDASPLLRQCWEGAIVSMWDRLGISGPRIQTRILQDAHSLVATNSTPLLCDAICKAATKVAEELVGPISMSFYGTDQLPLSLHNLIAQYLYAPQDIPTTTEMDEETENTIVAAAAIRSLAPFVSCAHNIRMLCESSSRQLRAQLAQENPGTLGGSLAITKFQKWLDKLDTYVEWLQSPEKLFFNNLRLAISHLSVVQSSYGKRYGANPYHGFGICISPYQVNASTIHEFCRKHLIPARSTVNQLNSINTIMTNLSFQDPNKRIFHETSNEFEFASPGFSENRTRERFITRALNEAVGQQIVHFWQVYFLENISFKATSSPFLEQPFLEQLNDDMG